MSIDNLTQDLRSRINPAYADTIGTESWERKVCADALQKQQDEIERLRAELAAAAFCDARCSWVEHHPSCVFSERDALRAELDALRRNNSYCPMCGSGTVPSVSEKRHYATGDGLVETMLGEHAKNFKTAPKPGE